jgi:hypothetical protein
LQQNPQSSPSLQFSRIGKSRCIIRATHAPSPDAYLVDSRTRLIQVTEDMHGFLGSAFPNQNGKPFPKAIAVVEGEP